MFPTDHEHTFVWDGEQLLPCECGANVLAVEAVLHAPAADARRVAGAAYYTGCRMRQELEAVELWLSDAPLQVVQELQAMHPGSYLIHNDAPRPRATVDGLRDSFDWMGWKTRGVKASAVGPTEDAYLHVGVLDDVDTAQKKLDEVYGHDVVRVSQQGPIVAQPYRGGSHAGA